MLDILFPKVCPSCETAALNSENLCGLCFSDIRFVNNWSFCRKCGVPFGFFNSEHEDYIEQTEESDDHLCGKCVQVKFCFEKARSIAIYDGKIREIIVSFKYEGKLSKGDVLVDILIANFPSDLDNFDYVVPVPLHIVKLRQRVYNQSAILANELAKYAGVNCDLFGLRRVRETRPQIEISSEDERRSNVKGAFSVMDDHKFRGKSVLLVDDVFTTGSTSDECSKMLLNSGAYKVQVITLTRAKRM
jgi:ComF family protein